MKKLENIDGLTDLSVHEQLEINGGESLWYHIGYAIGRTANAIANALQNPPKSSQDCN